FVAKPDPSVPQKDEPTFHYAINTDVTDTTGETRSATRDVNVGYTALKASLAADEWQTAAQPVKVTVSTQTLDGEGRPAKGMLKVYQLRAPAKVARAHLVYQHRQYWQEQAKEPAPDPANPNSWELG